jgi:hypothetical protein
MSEGKKQYSRNALATIRQRPAICLLALTVAAFTIPLLAQTGRGKIIGTVLDPSGAAVPAAKIQIVGTETNVAYNAETNGVGQYTLPNLPPGTYRVTATKEGFSATIQPSVILGAETERRVDFSLQPGTVQQSVTVEGEAPILDVSTTGNSTGVTDEYIHNMPLTLTSERRVITEYLTLIPGLVGGINNTLNDTSWTSQFNGSARGQTEVFVDGARASENEQNRGAFEETAPTVEAVGEITVVANAFNAEYGGFGAWFTQVTIKSGTNQFHGSLYDHMQNSSLNARTFFQPVVSPLRQNEGGGTFGGPVIIPKVYNGRDKTFFFFNQGAFIAHNGAQGTPITIPTVGFKQGDFSQLVNAAGVQIPIFDPATTKPSGTSFVRTQFPGNVIPTARITSISKAIAAMLPNPSLPGDINNAYKQSPAINYPYFDIYNTTLKLDHSLSDKTKLSLTYNYGFRDRALETPGWPLPATTPIENIQNQIVRTHSARLNHDYIISPTLLNHFTFAYDTYDNHQLGHDVGGDWGAKLGITGIPADNNDSRGMPSIGFSGGTAAPIAIGGGGVVHWAEQHFTLNNTLTWLKGTHEIKFGAFYGTDGQNQIRRGADGGSFSFSNAQTSQPLNNVNGNAFASFLLGAVNTAGLNFPVISGMRNKRYAAFVQDSWRMTQKFTLSYGLRYDYIPPQYEVKNYLSSFQPNLPNPDAGGILGAMAYAKGDSGFAQRFVNPWRKGFAPRLGIAYQINKKTVLRASGGVYLAQPLQSGPYTAGYSLSVSFPSPNGIDPSYYWTSPFPSNYLRPPQTTPSFLNGQSATWLNPQGNRAPQIVSWTIGIQREVARDLAVDVAYIGSKSTHLNNGRFNDQNYVPYQYLALGTTLASQIGSSVANAAGIFSPFPAFSSQSTHTVAQALRPYPQYTGVNFGEAPNPSGNSNFNSLQIKITKRFSRGLQIQSFYSWEKTQEFSPSNPAANRFTGNTLSSTDIPSTLQISATYELPFGPGKAFLNGRSAFENYVIGGWQFSASLRYEDGFPLSISGGGQLGGLGYTQSALYVGGNPYSNNDPRSFDPATSRYLNASAFAAPATYSFGNLPPNIGWVRGFTQKSEALTMSKKFRIKEKVVFELGLDAINPFNFVRWANPNTNVNSSATFGQVTNTQGPARTIQINGKLSF